MARRSSRERWQRLGRSHAVLGVGVLVVLLLLVGIARELVHRYEVRQQLADLQHQIATLEHDKTQLSGLLDDFSTPLFQEQEAREKLGKAKNGETVVIVPLTNTNSSVTTTENTPSDGSNPVKWWNYFFDRSSR